MLKDKEVEYANDSFLQMFQTSIVEMDIDFTETHQTSLKEKLLKMFNLST